MKLSKDTLGLLNKLKKKDRDAVDAIVRTHVAALRRHGLEPEYMDQVYIEAMQQVELAKTKPEPVAVSYVGDDYPLTNFGDTYFNPRSNQ